MVRKVLFYGYSPEELSKMKAEEVIDLLPSRARRTIKRGMISRYRKFLSKLRRQRLSGSKKPVKTHYRDMIVLPEMIGNIIGVYNGKEFVKVIIEPQMIGHYLGEFAPTRKRVIHSAPGVGATRSSMYVPLK